MKILSDLKTPMRDGVLLACTVYRPDDGERYPAVVMRTPYIKENFAGEWLYSGYTALALSGYNVVIQDVRGTGQSEGELLASGGNEARDGYDTIEWIAGQEWCDGNVGMYGLSYFGFTQMAAAALNPPHLKAICPFQNSALLPFSVSKAMTLGCYHLRWLYARVLDRLGQSGLTGAEQTAVREAIRFFESNWNEEMLRLPLRETEAARIPNAPLLADFIDLVDGIEDDAYWRKAGHPVALENISVPMFHLTGWFDGAKDGTIDNYMRIMERGTEAARAHSRLVIGPWLHGGGLSAAIDGYDFGAENTGAARGVDKMTKAWFDRWLKGRETEDYPPVSVFLLGANTWLEEREWPPARAEETSFYLHGGGGPKDGRIDGEVPGSEKPQHYVYDPEHPQPSDLKDSRGRTILADPAAWEDRADVLVFRSAPLEYDLEVMGQVRLILYAASTAVDTDFFCRVSDTGLDGTSFPLLRGIVRARFRNGRAPELIEPGKVYEYTIDLGGIANLFKAGHSIRLDLSSSNYPEHDRNLNTGARTGHGTVSLPAEQTIYHDAAHPSRLILPVV